MTVKFETQEAYTEALKINCSECGAKPGRKCETRGGKTSKTHFMRRIDWAEGKDPGPQQTHTERLADMTRAYIEFATRREYGVRYGDEVRICADLAEARKQAETLDGTVMWRRVFPWSQWPKD
jgi:hypothetical protein